MPQSPHRLRNDLKCVEWDIKPFELSNREVYDIRSHHCYCYALTLRPLCISDGVVNCFRRNHNVRDILKGISLGPKNLNFCDASNHFHHLFLFGDLNYRLDELDSVVSICHKLICRFLLLFY